MEIIINFLEYKKMRVFIAFIFALLFVLFCFYQNIFASSGWKEDICSMKSNDFICNKYVAPGQGYSGVGNKNNPWTIKKAFKEARAGDVVCFKDGVYHPDNNNEIFFVRVSGKKNNPIIFTKDPDTNGKVIIDGTILGDYGTDPDDVNYFGTSYAGVKVEGDNIVISGFEIRNFHYTNGVYLSGYSDAIKDCFIHNNGDNRIRRKGKPYMDYNGSGINPWHDAIICHNVIWGNGFVGYEHGIYGHGDGMVIKRNLFAFNAGAAIRASYIDNWKILNNVFLASENGFGFVPTNHADNIIVNNNIFVGGRIGIAKYSSGENYIDFSHNLFYGQSESAFANVFPAHNSIYADPKFVDIPSGVDDKKYDVHLQANSPAIDTGKYVGDSYSGEAPDLGIYEYIPANPPKEKSPDINSNGVTDVADLGIILSNWGRRDKGDYDVNQDGVVDGRDIKIILDMIS